MHTKTEQKKQNSFSAISQLVSTVEFYSLLPSHGLVLNVVFCTWQLTCSPFLDIHSDQHEQRACLAFVFGWQTAKFKWIKKRNKTKQWTHLCVTGHDFKYSVWDFKHEKTRVFWFNRFIGFIAVHVLCAWNTNCKWLKRGKIIEEIMP